MKVSVIIVNYNVKYFLELCLRSVLNAVHTLEVEVIVIDNQSSDGSLPFLIPKFPTVNFIDAGTNLGFGKASNLGLANATGEYILFLNPDTVLPPDALIKALDFFAHNTDAGAIGVKMIDGSGAFLKESKRSFPTPVTSLYKLFGLAALFPTSTVFSKYHLGYLNENKNHEVAVLSGAFMMIKKMILDQIGGFDEQFFMYGEDIDLSYRIQKAGFKNYYVSDFTIIHFKGESTRKGSLNYVKIFYQAMSIFVKKHYTGSQKKGFNIFIHIAIWIRAAITIAGNGVKNIKNALICLYRSNFKKFKIFKSTLPNKKPKLIAVLGSKDCKNLVELLLKPEENLIFIDPLLMEHSVSKQEILNKYQIAPFDEIIICVNQNTWKPLFYLINNLSTKVSYGFLLAEEKVILRSENKNTSGVIFVDMNDRNTSNP